MTLPKLGYPELEPGGSQKHLTFNEVLRAVDLMMQRRVDSIYAFQDPIDPGDIDTFGDTHVIGSDPSGEWAGKFEYIARFDAGRWWYVPPRVGMILWSPADQSLVVYFDVGYGPAWNVLSDL